LSDKDLNNKGGSTVYARQRQSDDNLVHIVQWDFDTDEIIKINTGDYPGLSSIQKYTLDPIIIHGIQDDLVTSDWQDEIDAEYNLLDPLSGYVRFVANSLFISRTVGEKQNVPSCKRRPLI